MKRWRGLLLLIGTFSLLLGIWMLSMANSKDKDLYFFREVLSPLTQGVIADYIFDTNRWPEWFQSLKEAQILSEDAHAGGLPIRTILSVGDKVRLVLSSKNAISPGFEVIVQVMVIDPGTRLKLRVLSDSKGKLLEMFEYLEWEVEVSANPLANPVASAKTGSTLSMIRGRGVAKTRSWRARLMGSIAEKILMSQVFYPNLISLAQKGSVIPKAEAPFMRDSRQ